MGQRWEIRSNRKVEIFSKILKKAACKLPASILDEINVWLLEAVRGIINEKCACLYVTRFWRVFWKMQIKCAFLPQ